MMKRGGEHNPSFQLKLFNNVKISFPLSTNSRRCSSPQWYGLLQSHFKCTIQTENIRQNPWNTIALHSLNTWFIRPWRLLAVGLRAVLVGKLRVSRMDSIRFPQQLNKPQSTDLLTAPCTRQFLFTAPPQECPTSTPTTPINVNCLILYNIYWQWEKWIRHFFL